MPANFPDNPTLGQQFSIDGRTWTWTGAVWNSVLSETKDAFTPSDTPPSPAEDGKGWFDTVSGQFFVYYDGSWVEFGTNLAGAQGPAGATGDDGVIVSATAPENTDVLWLDTSDPANQIGVPAGGTTGQVLIKASTTDYDTEWSSDIQTQLDDKMDKSKETFHPFLMGL